jgi:hypothetical protein
MRKALHIRNFLWLWGAIASRMRIRIVGNIEYVYLAVAPYNIYCRDLIKY